MARQAGERRRRGGKASARGVRASARGTQPGVPADGEAAVGSDAPTSAAEIAAAAGLDAEHAELFVKAVEAAMRRRRVMMTGYLAAAFAVVIGQFFALGVWGNRTPGSFVGWVFLLPPGLAAVILIGTARLVRRIKLGL